jgi:hypothetical protein
LADLVSLAIECGIVQIDGEVRIGGAPVTTSCAPRRENDCADSAGYPAAPGRWRWSAIGHLPPEEPGRGHDREGTRNYSELLAQRPVLETLEIVERHFRSLVPEHEL